MITKFYCNGQLMQTVNWNEAANLEYNTVRLVYSSLEKLSVRPMGCKRAEQKDWRFNENSFL